MNNPNKKQTPAQDAAELAELLREGETYDLGVITLKLKLMMFAEVTAIRKKLDDALSEAVFFLDMDIDVLETMTVKELVDQVDADLKSRTIANDVVSGHE